MQSGVERLPLELTAFEREHELLIAGKGFLLPHDGRDRRPRRDEEGGGSDEHPVVVFKEGWRSWGGGPAVHHEKRERHGGADGHNLQNPSLVSTRQPPRPHLEE